MFIAADYPLFEILWTGMVFTWGLLIVWTIVAVLVDVFRRDDLSGGAKAGWTALTIVLPLLGVLIYLVKHGKTMGQRRTGRARRPVAAVPRSAP